MNVKKQFKDGLITQNPVLVQLLGMCSTMAITTTLFNGVGMGLSVLIILTCCNIAISALRKIIPNDIRIAIYVVVIAGFVTIVDLMLKAYIPALSEALGVFIPLIVVNCIILGRAEAYASKNPPLPSLFDGIGMGLGFTIGLTIIGTIREVLGNGSFFGIAIPGYEPMAIFVRAPGAFLVLAILVAIMNASGIKNRANKMTEGCDGCCASCSSSCDKKEG